MPRLLIDNQPVDVPPGSTILDAARKIGMDIPTLCFLEGCRPSTSCMVCLVKLKGTGRMVPSCATPVEDGMKVESETSEVHRMRRTGLELLLSDHLGDCTAPCQNTCPCDMDIPLMLHQVEDGALGDAIATIKKEIALPAVLGRVCPDICEKGCRRGRVDSPAAICQVKRYVADVDLATNAPYVPSKKPGTGKRVAIVGAGPTGLSAAFHLLLAGHACTLIDDKDAPGGSLRTDFTERDLPRVVLDAEIACIERLGATFRLGVRVGRVVSLGELRADSDAVLVAIGHVDKVAVAELLHDETSTDASHQRLSLAASNDRLRVDGHTLETSMPGVFAAGDAVTPNKLVVRSVAAGKAAALCIDQFLTHGQATGFAKPFAVRMGRLAAEEIVQLSVGASTKGRVIPSSDLKAGLTGEEAKQEAGRCLHCECAHHAHCKLRHYADAYGAGARQYGTRSREFERHHQPSGVIFEPGKCILCGLCVQIATDAREPLGLTFVGRGFDMRLAVPFDRPMADALQRVAKRCVDACPTGALALRE